jgi:hypothetical protein
MALVVWCATGEGYVIGNRGATPYSSMQNDSTGKGKRGGKFGHQTKLSRRWEYLGVKYGLEINLGGIHVVAGARETELGDSGSRRPVCCSSTSDKEFNLGGIVTLILIVKG